jgi:hypothetical protein
MAVPCFACQSKKTVYDGRWLCCQACGRSWEVEIDQSSSNPLFLSGPQAASSNGQNKPSRKKRTSRRNKANRRQGEQGEDIARMQLALLGVRRLEKIEVGWKVLRDDDGHIVGAFPMEKVSGDFKGILPGGTAVHVEVKSRGRSDRLRHSDLKAHQIEALDEHVSFDGLGLVCWVTAYGECLVMRWPIPGFRPHTSLTIDQAQQYLWPGHRPCHGACHGAG